MASCTQQNVCCCNLFFGVLQKQGIVDPVLGRMARCGKTKTDSHICRNLDRLVHREGRLLPVQVSAVPTSIRTRKRATKLPVNFPVLKLSDWLAAIFKTGGHFLLGGRSMNNLPEFQEELLSFWRLFRDAEPNFPLFKDFPEESSWSSTIPLALHGDEGRGRRKLAVMILSYQTILPIRAGKTNMKGMLGVCL